MCAELVKRAFFLSCRYYFIIYFIYSFCNLCCHTHYTVLLCTLIFSRYSSSSKPQILETCEITICVWFDDPAQIFNGFNFMGIPFKKSFLCDTKFFHFTIKYKKAENCVRAYKKVFPMNSNVLSKCFCDRKIF